jgi:hypothetical protein
MAGPSKRADHKSHYKRAKIDHLCIHTSIFGKERGKERGKGMEVGGPAVKLRTWKMLTFRL